ncbi:MAG: NAD(P)-dependent alcohol dehydrogenase [bacterium]|nr:NAD(P)-dependent alcohol dehydrogenase [bacterium]
MENTMKTMILTAYGTPDVMELKQAGIPEPKENEVQLKVIATTVTKGDCELRSFKIHPLFWLPLRLYMGVLKPRVKVIGQEFSGEITAVGSEVTEYEVGEKVYGPTGLRMGSYREYICLPKDHPLSKIPEGMNPDEAATIPTGGLNALHFMRKAKIKKGDRLLINGAGGSIGTYSIQIAKDMGAHITCVDSKGKFELLKEAGADEVIDYESIRFWELDKKYDIIFDIFGNAPYYRCIDLLNAGGAFLMGNPKTLYMFIALLTRRFLKDKRVIFQFASDNKRDLLTLSKMVENGIIKSFVDKVYPFESLSDAHRYVDQDLKKGNVIIKMT